MTLDEIELDARRFVLYIGQKEYDSALEVIGRNLSNLDPFVEKLLPQLLVRDAIGFYVGLRREGRDREAYIFSQIVSDPITGLLNKEVLDDHFYKSLVGSF